MKRWHVLIAFITGLVLFLSACGTSSHHPDPTVNLTEGNARELSKLALEGQGHLLNMLPDSAGASLKLSSGHNLPKQLVGLLPQRGLTTLEEETCISFEGDLTDTDLDEIPVAAKAVFDCAFSEDGSDMTITGSAYFQDADDQDVLSGYAIRFEDFVTTESKDGQMSRLELDQSFILAIDELKSLYVIENDLELNATTAEGSFSYSELATLGYAPDDVAVPFVAGTFALNSVTTWQSGTDVYQLTGIAPALHYSATCESGFDAGTIAYEDNAGNSLGLVYNACNNVTVLYNGSSIAQ